MGVLIAEGRPCWFGSVSGCDPEVQVASLQAGEIALTARTSCDMSRDRSSARQFLNATAALCMSPCRRLLRTISYNADTRWSQPPTYGIAQHACEYGEDKQAIHQLQGHHEFRTLSNPVCSSVSPSDVVIRLMQA
jgi:hypothetical protein